MRPRTAVEFGDQVPGGREHDRIESCRPIRNPSVECILGGGGDVADVDAIVIKVEVEHLRFAFAEHE